MKNSDSTKFSELYDTYFQKSYLLTKSYLHIKQAAEDRASDFNVFMRKNNVYSDSSINIADSILYNLLNLYNAPKHGLLIETYPKNIHNQVDYFAEGSHQKKEQEVSFLWSYSGIISGVVSLYKETKLSKYLLLLKQQLLTGLEYLMDSSDNVYLDNISLDGKIDERKYNYNCGQMIETAVLLYKHTNNNNNLTDAQKTALGIHQFLQNLNKL